MSVWIAEKSVNSAWKPRICQIHKLSPTDKDKQFYPPLKLSLPLRGSRYAHSPFGVGRSLGKTWRDVQIGPFWVVENDVTIGSQCILENHVVIKSGTTLGERTISSRGRWSAVFPSTPGPAAGQVIIGSGNTIRENVTIHKAMQPDHHTVIGDHCLLMCNAHVAHDCHLGDHVILTNNVMLAGHVTVGSRAFLSAAQECTSFVAWGPWPWSAAWPTLAHSRPS